MKKVIKGWEHIPGIHCGSAALRDVAGFYGLPLSEPMCFGLGGGLGFFYLIDNEISPTRNIHLRGPDMEPNFFSLFSDKKEWMFEKDNEKALQTVLDYLDRDIPVLIQTDIFYLDYYNSGTHFPGHILVVSGYDSGKEEIYLSDTGFNGLQAVSFKNFKKSRSAKIKPYPLSNNWFDVSRLNTEADLQILIPRAIKTNALNMLAGVTSPRGVSGVERILELSKDIVNWKGVEDWKWCFRYSYQVIQKRGTCGAGFRWMYRDFLNEAKDYYDFEFTEQIAIKMDHIGNEWFELSEFFKKISEQDSPDSFLTHSSQRLFNIYNLEKNFYTEIVSNL
ncbi:MAG: BtrH N-terminal domain-containing protein [Candidatus Dadabacteria bacterium]|nr:BtrH N-terminal domain-containing protein [Candidatus Dadabacteria bacterium]NIS07442.1 BtrH N-terminal domain-containing protein [Candidatus Dadabacteria bacterium]NIY21094.1 DUF4872 domain-containing protein [Candidatus Dadabacteria bacterium]